MAWLAGDRSRATAARGNGLHMAELLPFVATLWLLVSSFGLVGAAVAWTLRTTVDCLILLRIARCWNRDLLRAVPAVALMLLCYAVTQVSALPPRWSVPAAFGLGALMLASGVALDSSLRGIAHGMLPAALRPGESR